MAALEQEIGGISISAGVYEGEGWIAVGMDADCSGAISVTIDEAKRLSHAFAAAAEYASGRAAVFLGQSLKRDE